MSSYVIYLYIYMFIGLLLIRCLLSVVRTIYSVSTLCVYLRCPLLVLLLSVKLGVSALGARYYLLGVYFLWCVLLTSVYFRYSVLPVSEPRASTSHLSARVDVSISGGLYILHGVYYYYYYYYYYCYCYGCNYFSLFCNQLCHRSGVRDCAEEAVLCSTDLSSWVSCGNSEDRRRNAQCVL